MDTDSKQRLCTSALQLDESCIALYESAFPEGEREPVGRLKSLIAEGKMLYHRTLDEDGDLLCFTLVSLADEFSFLAYMATNPQKRSSGIGTKHLTRLVELLKEQYPTHIGLFLEIEATAPRVEKLTEEELRTRMRRRVFYERLGARVMCADGIYLTPSMSEPGKEWEGELMAIEFRLAQCEALLSEVVRTIYQRFYCLPTTHPVVLKVLAHFDGCKKSCDLAVSTGGHRSSCDQSRIAVVGRKFRRRLRALKWRLLLRLLG